MGAENKKENSIDIPRSAQESSQTSGTYLFGDYTPFEENKNIIDVLKDFISISEHVIQIHVNVDKLNLLLKNAETLRELMNLKINQFKLSSESEVDKYFDEFYEKLAKVYFPDQIGVEPFLRIKNSILRSISDVERESSTSFDEYKTYLASKKDDFYMSSVRLVQTWLSKDEPNLPNQLVSSSTNTLIAKVEETGEQYSISRLTQFRVESDEEERKTQSTSFSYSFSIDASVTGFWKSARRIFDLGIDQISVPIGFKTSISEKLRRSFRIGHSNDHHHDSDREPETVSLENYYVTHAKLESGNTLSVILSAEAKPRDKVIRIEYDLNDLHAAGKNSAYEGSKYEQVVAEGRVPRVEYIDEKETRRIDLLQKEFLRVTDIGRIMDMGSRIEVNLQQLIDMRAISSYVKLYSITVGDKEAILIANRNSVDGHISYYEDLVVSFLERIASAFAPVIQVLKSKSPVKGELIMRYDSPDKQRQEYMIRTSDMISRLSPSSSGHRILAALGFTNENGTDSKVENITKT